ncbi:MAG: hypothetical protein ACE15B_02315 [Bryobacteraceae bacterium]
MNRKTRLALWLAAAAAVAGISFWAWVQYRRSAIGTPQAMLRQLPVHDSVVLYVDFGALRRLGIMKLLAGSPLEKEYLEFVRNTGFDYTTDLDAAMAAFRPAGEFLVLRGRFDWEKLRAYTVSHGGACEGALCRMSGSAPDRKISFQPLRRNVMAMAVAMDDAAVLQILGAAPGGGPGWPLPSDPVWVALPGAALRAPAELPSGTRIFARALDSAQSAVISLGPEGKHYAARMVVQCRSAEEANNLAGQLYNLTQLLVAMIQREKHQPNPRDLSGVLTSGSFRTEGDRVHGYWPVSTELLQALFSGTA